MDSPDPDSNTFSDAGFASFQDFWRKKVAPADSLWLQRGIVYFMGTWMFPTKSPITRFQHGRLGWILWLVSHMIKRRPDTSAMRSGGGWELAFLFYGASDAHFMTLWPLAESLSVNHTLLIWASQLNQGQLHRLESLPNTRVIRLEMDWVFGRLPDLIRDLRAAWAQTRRALAIARPLGLYSKQQPVQSVRLFSAFFHARNWRRYWSRFFQGTGARGVFVTSENIEASALFYEARKHGVRAIHWTHGLLSTSHQVTMATDFCVFSRPDREYLTGRVPGDCRIHCIGNPRLEFLRQTVPPLEEPVRHPFHALFLSQDTGSGYSRENRASDMRIIARGNTATADYIVRLRPHPSEPCLEELREDAAQAGLCDYEWSTSDLKQDLIWSDVVASACSTGMLEAAVAGRACYWTNARSELWAGADKLCGAGVGKLITSPSAWQTEAEHLHENAGQLLENQNRALNELKITGYNTAQQLKALNLSTCTAAGCLRPLI